MLGGFAAAAAIILFVTAHEAGHFFAAKATGMKVTEFFFGFGPRIWSKRRGETEYGLKLLPLGGYVRIIGMNPLEEVAPADMGRTYREKLFWEKSVVVLAGDGARPGAVSAYWIGMRMSGWPMWPFHEPSTNSTAEWRIDWGWITTAIRS